MYSAHLGSIVILSMFALAACGDDDGSGAGGSGGAPGATSSSSSSSGGGGGEGGSTGNPGAALLGTWKSKECEVTSPMSSQRRTYVFEPTGITLAFEQYVGTGCEAGPKLLTVNVHGTSEILGPSQAVPGAMEVIFTIETKAITPAAAGVDFLEGACAQYPWMADVEQDIKKDGCGELSPSEADCPAEYDLSAIVDGALYFGDRSHPLCSAETRPTALSRWGIVKQP